MVRMLFVASLLAGVSGAALAQPKPMDDQEDVVITGAPIAGFATTVESVNRQDILEAGGASLADALANVPGVSGSGFAAGASRPVIRGMDANRVKILEDGVSSSDVSDIGPDHGVPIDPLSSQRIEVVRGAGTLRYGSQAIGGVINSINNRVPLDLPGDPLEGEASLSYGSAADAREGAALLDGKLGRFAFQADGFTRRADDYDTPLGVQANSFFHGDGYSFGGSFIPQKGGHVGAAVIHYDSKYGIPSDETYIDMRQTKVLTSSLFHIDLGALQTLSTDLGFATYVHDEKDPGGAILSTFKNQEWDGRSEMLFGALGPLSSSALGVQVQNRKFSAGGEGGDYLSPTLMRGGALFGFTEAPLGKSVKLQAAARMEKVGVEGTPASLAFTHRDFAPISGSAGLVVEPNDAVKLGLTFASAARVPAVTELFAHGPHDGPGTFETGDPSLGLERANSLEATLRLRASRFRFDGSAWAAHFGNYIYGALTGRTCEDDGTCFADDTHELKELNYTAADARFWGLEGKASLDLFTLAGGTLEVDTLADLTRADFTNNGGPVPRIQPYRLGAGLSWENDKFDAGFMLMHSGAQKRVPAGDDLTSGFESLDAHASWKPFGAAKGLQLALVGSNLTDDVQRNAIALNRDEVIAPGRNIRLVIRQEF